jgi:hypothetical protein
MDFVKLSNANPYLWILLVGALTLRVMVKEGNNEFLILK